MRASEWERPLSAFESLSNWTLSWQGSRRFLQIMPVFCSAPAVTRRKKKEDKILFANSLTLQRIRVDGENDRDFAGKIVPKLTM